MNIYKEIEQLNAKCDRLAETLRRKNKFAAVTEGGAGESRPERPEPSQLLTPAISPQLSNRLTPETDAAVIASNGQWLFVLRETCERLERERDAAREQIKGWELKWKCAVEIAALAQNKLEARK